MSGNSDGFHPSMKEEDRRLTQGRTDQRAPSPSSILKQEDLDYEALFMKDAVQRAHDAELAALASLALIRSDMDENDLMFALERDQMLSPRMVDKHLREDEKPRK